MDSHFHSQTVGRIWVSYLRNGRSFFFIIPVNVAATQRVQKKQKINIVNTFLTAPQKWILLLFQGNVWCWWNWLLINIYLPGINMNLFQNPADGFPFFIPLVSAFGELTVKLWGITSHGDSILLAASFTLHDRGRVGGDRTIFGSWHKCRFRGTTC